MRGELKAARRAAHTDAIGHRTHARQGLTQPFKQERRAKSFTFVSLRGGAHEGCAAFAGAMRHFPPRRRAPSRLTGKAMAHLRRRALDNDVGVGEQPRLGLVPRSCEEPLVLVGLVQREPHVEGELTPLELFLQRVQVVRVRPPPSRNGEAARHVAQRPIRVHEHRERLALELLLLVGEGQKVHCVLHTGV
eukprot:6812433-Prymnesium_polylepis.2